MKPAEAGSGSTTPKKKKGIFAALIAILAVLIIVIIVLSQKKSDVVATRVNYDGTWISVTVFEKGKEAAYTGETPSRAEDVNYCILYFCASNMTIEILYSC